MKVEPVTVEPVRVCGVPSLDMRISTISNETSDALNAGLSSITQFTVTVDTMLFTGLDGVLVTDTEDGGGTEEKKSSLLLYGTIILY